MYKLKIAIGLLVMLYLTMLLTNTKVFISETRVNPGDDYYLEEWGNLGDASQTSLVCKYFNGRKFMSIAYWYSPNNILGKDSCPIIIFRQN